jgi:hypothetical protein
MAVNLNQTSFPSYFQQLGLLYNVTFALKLLNASGAEEKCDTFVSVKADSHVSPCALTLV